MRSDLWHVIWAERAALVEDLSGLTADHWATPSLCSGWDVHDVAAHVAATATLSLSRFAKELILNGFNPDRIVARQVAVARQHEPSRILAALRSATYATASPPQPTITRIIEILVHGEDIRRPLHIGHDYSAIHIGEALDYLRRDRRSGAKARLAGLQLRATDADITIGDSRDASVQGPAMALLLAAAGRSVALTDLRGPGVPILETRVSQHDS